MEVLIDGTRYVPLYEPKGDMKSLSLALDLRFNSDAGRDITIRDYLYRLLDTLLSEGRGFSSLCPFPVGKTNWEYDVYVPLIKAGYIFGSIDERGAPIEFDDEDARALVRDLACAVFYSGTKRR